MSPSVSGALPSRTVSWRTASAAGTPRSSSIAAANASGSSTAASTAPTTSRGPLDEALDPPERRLRLGERLLGVLDVRAVVRAAEVVAQLDRPHPLDHLGDEQRVAERLAHLLARRGDPGVVHPVTREPLADGRRLGDLVLVVREAQVDAAAVDVEGVAEVLARPSPSTRGASRGARAPRRRPRRLAGLGALPQREVARVALAARVRVGRPAPSRRASAGQLAVRRPGPHVEVDVARAVLGGVGVPALDERAASARPSR